MTHQNNINVFLMIYETNIKNPEQIIKLNVKKGYELASGDKILSNKRNDTQYGFEIGDIIENRQSSLNDYNYITCSANFKQI